MKNQIGKTDFKFTCLEFMNLKWQRKDMMKETMSSARRKKIRRPSEGWPPYLSRGPVPNGSCLKVGGQMRFAQKCRLILFLNHQNFQKKQNNDYMPRPRATKLKLQARVTGFPDEISPNKASTPSSIL